MVSRVVMCLHALYFKMEGNEWSGILHVQPGYDPTQRGLVSWVLLWSHAWLWSSVLPVGTRACVEDISLKCTMLFAQGTDEFLSSIRKSRQRIRLASYVWACSWPGMNHKWTWLPGSSKREKSDTFTEEGGKAFCHKGYYRGLIHWVLIFITSEKAQPVTTPSLNSWNYERTPW